MKGDPALLAIAGQIILSWVSFASNVELINVSGSHAFTPPGPNDQRGPCPGLNALANHHYLPHNGVATIKQFIDATTSVFGMGDDLATFLAYYAAYLDGNLVSWSIGGPSEEASAGGHLGQPQGLSYSHNRYESDASPTRGDLYQYGDASTLQMRFFKELYYRQNGSTANYNLDIIHDFHAKRLEQSKTENPYFFSGPFSGVLTSNAAFQFIYRFMANHSTEHPEGVLDQDVLKTFYAVTGNGSELEYNRGNERIPDNWYRRASGDEYTIPYLFADLRDAARKYPQFLVMGGNTGSNNSFSGINPSDLSGGAYNFENLREGNNAACFFLQIGQQLPRSDLRRMETGFSYMMSTIGSMVSEVTSAFSCPQLSNINTSEFSQFPGYTN